MDEPDAPRGTQLRTGRKVLFWVLCGLLVAVLVEGGARFLELASARWHGRDGVRESNLYVEIKNPVPVFELGEIDGRRVYRRTSHHQWIEEDLAFAAKKAPNALRIFCVGGSAAHGWPHDQAHSYPGILARKLELLLPGHEIEVVNAAGFTYASHRVKFVFEEVLEYEPDLILVYSGNNEFLENFVYRSRSLGSPWSHLAVARIVHQWRISQRQPDNVIDVENYGQADHRTNRLSFAFGRASRLREDIEQLREVEAHYRFNIESMLARASERDVPVMLLTVPVNLRDWVPNVSLHRSDLEAADLEKWQQSYREGIFAVERGDDATAVEFLEQAIAIDDAYAESHFQLARAQQRLGEVEAARASYQRAYERDGYPFRALPQFNAALEQIATERGVRLIDIRAALLERSEDGIPGLDVLIDYVHPTVASNEVIADEVLNAMQDGGLLPAGLAASLGDVKMDIPPGVEESFRVLRSIYVQYLNMRQYDELDRLSDRLVAAADRVAETEPEMAGFARDLATRTRRTQRVVRDYRELLRAEKLGLLEQKFTREEAEATYRRYVELVRELEGRDIPHQQFDEYVPELVYRVDAGEDSR